MDTLVCEFPDKVRFFDTVLRDGAGRVFVQTDRTLRPPTPVELEVRFGPGHGVEVPAKVVAVRRRGGVAVGQNVGVWVEVNRDRVDELQGVLRLERGEAARVTNRREPRVPASARVEIASPVHRTVRTADISEHGLRIASALPVPVSQTLKLDLELEAGNMPIPVFGRVAWGRPDLNLTGIELRFQNDRVRHAIERRVQHLRGSSPRVAASRPTVLVVDDDEELLRGIETVLTKHGYSALVATSGPEALSLARQTSPSLMVLDVMMPGMNGVEVCHVLKRDAETSDIPVVLSSGLSEPELATKLREAGALVALPKPYRFTRMQALVEAILDQHRSVQPEQANRRRKPYSAFFESETLRVVGTLRDLSATEGCIGTVWCDPVGTRARLTVTPPSGDALSLSVEVTSNSGWEIESECKPGMKFRVVDPPAEIDGWLGEHAQELSRRDILLVANNPELERALQRRGFEVASVSSTGAIEAAVAAAQPALVILDRAMPGLDVKRVGAAVKSASPRPAVWIASPSSVAVACSVAEAMGADGWISRDEPLLDVVARAVSLLGP